MPHLIVSQQKSKINAGGSSLAAAALPISLTRDPSTGTVWGIVGPVGRNTTLNFNIEATDFSSMPKTTTRSERSDAPGGSARNDICAAGTIAGPTAIFDARLRIRSSPYGDIDVYSIQGDRGRKSDD